MVDYEEASPSMIKLHNSGSGKGRCFFEDFLSVPTHPHACTHTHPSTCMHPHPPIHMHAHTPIHMHAHTHTHPHACTHPPIHMHAHTPTHPHACMYTHPPIHMHAHTPTHPHACMHTHPSTCMHAHTQPITWVSLRWYNHRKCTHTHPHGGGERGNTRDHCEGQRDSSEPEIWRKMLISYLNCSIKHSTEYQTED